MTNTFRLKAAITSVIQRMDVDGGGVSKSTLKDVLQEEYPELVTREDGTYDESKLTKALSEITRSPIIDIRRVTDGEETSIYYEDGAHMESSKNNLRAVISAYEEVNQTIDTTKLLQPNLLPITSEDLEHIEMYGELSKIIGKFKEDMMEFADTLND